MAVDVMAGSSNGNNQSMVWNTFETSIILWAQVSDGYPDSMFNLVKPFFPAF